MNDLIPVETSNHAVVVLDETGSMSGQQARVVDSMNEYIKTLPKDCHLTVFKFDSARWTTFFDDQVSAWVKMREDDYRPGAMTPLYDAVSKGIAHVETRANDGDKVLVMIDTDGKENCSTEHTYESVTALIDSKKAAGWEIMFVASAITEKAAEAVATQGVNLGATRTMRSSYAGRTAMFSASGAVGKASMAYFADKDVPDTKAKDWGGIAAAGSGGWGDADQKPKTKPAPVNLKSRVKGMVPGRGVVTGRSRVKGNEHVKSFTP